MPEIGPKHQPVLCRRDADGVAVVTIDRPERRNALNLEVKSRIAEVVSELVADDTVRVIVLTGSGDYFVAGTDIAEMATMTPAQHVTLGTDHVFNVMRRCPKPLIAALEGYALGGGCELALTCDMIIAGRSTKLGQPEIRVGIMPGAGGTQHLLRTIGKYRASKMVLTGEPVAAPDALAMGPVVRDGRGRSGPITRARTGQNDRSYAPTSGPGHQGGYASRPRRAVGNGVCSGAQSLR